MIYFISFIRISRTEAEILEHFNVGSLAKSSSKTLLPHFGSLVLRFSEKADAAEFLRQVNGLICICLLFVYLLVYLQK